MRRNEPTPEEQEVEEMKQAARVIKEICDRRTADDACSFCPFYDMCRTEPFDKLMKQYGIDEAEIAEERLEKCFFRYKTPYERKLLVQVIYTVTGKIPFKCVGSYSGRARKQVGIDCTAAERLEIEFSYEFYKAALEEEMERFYSAFLMKNDIFPPASKKAEEIPAAEISRSEALKLQALMAGMGDHTRRPALGSGVGP